ncbi:MAG: adenylate/guanylate cyclase domain-containing protein [Candidatus Binatia bacterium]
MHRQMHYRIGLNVGDIVVEGERIYGDGVNIAARIESLADGGGISISGTVYDQIANKLPFACEYQGEQSVKNIAKPVRVYRLVREVPSPLVGEGQGEGVVDEAEKQAEKSQKHNTNRSTRRVRPAHQWMIASVLLLAGVLITVRYVSLPLFTLHSSLRKRSFRSPTNPPLLSFPSST